MIAIYIATAVLLALMIYFVNRKPKPTPKNYTSTLPKNLTIAELSLITRINKHRLDKDLPQLQMDAVASELADKHCKYMIKEGKPSHDKFPDRVYALKNISTKVGEVVAFGYNSSKGFMNGYLSSPEHKAIMENENFTHIGTRITERYNTTILFRYVNRTV